MKLLIEKQCRAITLRINEEIMWEADHTAMIFAKNGIGAYFPNLQIIYRSPEQRPDSIVIEYIHGFDRESYSYYS